MEYSLDLPEAARSLLARIELTGSPQALRTMTDQELDRWTQTCWRMAARPGRANTAHRTWRRLLREARAENATRHRSPHITATGPSPPIEATPAHTSTLKIAATGG